NHAFCPKQRWAGQEPGSSASSKKRPQRPKQLPAGGPEGSGALRGAVLPSIALAPRGRDTPAPFCPVEPGAQAGELIECGLVLSEQALPPALRALEKLRLERIPLAAGCERRPDGLGIDVPHELADV